jgi:UDP-glucuronate decarboxylase
MKKILVTGERDSGSHLCTRLINEGHDVICLDNYFTGDKKNILHLMDNFELVRHDITEPFMLRLMKYTIWLAQLAHYQYNYKND